MSAREGLEGVSLLQGVASVALVHAHPDDETISTGALIVALRRAGVAVRVLTCTRGERGEIVPGTFDVSDAAALNDHRESELRRAEAVLGVEGPEFLGTPPARVSGAEPVRYSDSGMRWVREGLAGPAEDAPAEAFSLQPVSVLADDLAAWLGEVDPDLVVTYDAGGGYGHPDHVQARLVSEDACARLGLRLAEVVAPGTPGSETLDASLALATVTEALNQHRTQLTVDGTDIVHVGGQREAITTVVGLRLAEDAKTVATSR